MSRDREVLTTATNGIVTEQWTTVSPVTTVDSKGVEGGAQTRNCWAPLPTLAEPTWLVSSDLRFKRIAYNGAMDDTSRMTQSASLSWRTLKLNISSGSSEKSPVPLLLTFLNKDERGRGPRTSSFNHRDHFGDIGRCTGFDTPTMECFQDGMFPRHLYLALCYTPRAPQYLSGYRGLHGIAPLRWDHFNVESTQETYLLTQGPRRESLFNMGMSQGFGGQTWGPSGVGGATAGQAWITECLKEREYYLLAEKDEEEDEVE
ncbi:UNVERIFIED_CONTAM: hypothetical protein K2H54_052411 [Gekko kuhli]